MKISVKLGLGFGILSVILVAILFLSMKSLSDLDLEINEIVKDKYPKTVLVNNIRIEITNVARILRTLLLTEDKETIDKERAKIKKSGAIINEAVDSLKKTITSA